MAEVFRQFMHAQEQQEQRYLQALQTLQVTMQQAIQPASSSLGLESPRMELPTPAPRRISLSPRVPHTPTLISSNSVPEPLQNHKPVLDGSGLKTERGLGRELPALRYLSQKKSLSRLKLDACEMKWHKSQIVMGVRSPLCH
ncbi:hypothetical protein HF521_015482 [Silurus meridionalis]|uniref:Uncharacterized protein n=1 Tax=Silurus meridionalis TaxID=175797 RepID=A0A8T0A5E8_SILME|nr:hypothetical protein HF521_015482 [Silurus meridionalis]